MGLEVVHWINLAEDGVKWRDFVNIMYKTT